MTTSTQKILSGYKQTEIGMIPVDWDVKRLGDIGDSIIGLTYSPSEVADYGRLVHRSSNVQDNQLSYNDNVYVDKIINEKLILRENDILICVRNGSRDLIGKSALIKGRAVGETFGAFMSVFRSEKNQQFIFWLILSNIVQRQINQSLGATINQITNKTLNDFQIPYPPKPEEQIIIAKTISDSDELIEKLKKLIRKKKSIKKGAMQELLTGKLRLPGFSGKWEVKKLGVVVNVNKGIQKGRAKLTDSGKYPVWNGGVEPSGYSEEWNANENTITISEGGNSCGFVNYCKQKFWLGGHCYAIEIIKNNIDPIFFYQKLKYKETLIMSLRVGSGLPNIQKKNLLSIDFSFPNDKSEQTAIATVLFDMDTEIEKLESQLTKYKNIKQGMMQTLLTGKIRLINNG
jgi:type I restriction enzyme S subunit